MSATGSCLPELLNGKGSNGDAGVTATGATGEADPPDAIPADGLAAEPSGGPI